MDSFIARKVKDVWLVDVKDTRHFYNKKSVIMLAKQNGLEIKKEFSTKDKIIAE